MQELRTEPRQRRSRQSIDAILDAAERLIHQQGQVAFTANELAVAASMSIGRVYYWFPDIPSVVAALAEREAERLIRLFATVLEVEDAVPTPTMIASTLDALTTYIDANPATVALCLSGRGQQDYGVHMRESMAEVAATMVRQRVPGVPEAEVHVVARTVVGITLGMLHGYVDGDPTVRPLIRQELVYVLSAWLLCRYPSADDPVWNDPHAPIQPSRLPIVNEGPFTPVYPALSPRQPQSR